MADIIPDNIREFDDTKSARKNIYDNTLEAMKRRFPIEDDNYKLELVDLQYEGKQDFSLAEQKKAILNNQNLRTNLVGTWRLTDKKTGNVVDERRSSVMQVPYWTDRGTIINNGSEYTVISQSRLRPGVYTRKKSNGEFETQFNVKPGTGHAFHFGLNPETGIMTLQTGQGSVPLYQVLKGIGVEDKDIIKHWGAEVTANNAKKADPQAWNKLYRRWAGYKAIPNATELDKIQFVKDALATYEVDPEVVERTLGLRNVTSLTPNVLLRASQKLLNISRGDEQPDNRDNPRFSKFYGVEDYFKERIDKNAGRLTNTLFYKVKRNGNLKSIQSNALNPWVDTIINGSGLAMPGEEANPLSTLEQMSRISKFGLGGIGSKDAVTMEARDVQGDYLGFVDNVAGPECFTPGSYIMSKTGFIPIEDVTYNTELACLINNRLEYHTPERVISEHYSGDIYIADTKFIQYKVTNNHRIWHKKDTLTYSFNTAEQVHKQDITLMTGGHAPYVSNKVITEFSLPHTDHNIPAIDIETWGAFLGYFLSTGSVSCYNIYIPKTCPEHINDLTYVLNKLPLTYTVHNNDFVLSNDKLALYLSQFTNERHIPDYMFDATVEGRKAFLNALHHSQPANDYAYTTTSSRLAYDIERICFTLGLSANVYHKHSKTSTWVVRFNQKQEYTLSSNSLWLKCDYGIEPYNGIVYCVTVPGGLVYARYGDTGAHWTGNSEAIGVDVRASYKTFLGKDNKLYGEFINRTTGKTEYVDIATAADRLVAFPGQDLSKPYVMAIKDGIPQKVPSSDVKYAVPSYAHMVASNTNMNPMPTTVQAGRQFYGSKFWSQYLPQAKGEVPLVDTLMPDGKLTWREYYGRKVGTLKSEVDGVVTKVEDNMVTVKDNEGKLHKTELVKSLPFNRLSAISYFPSVEVGQTIKAGDMIAHSNFTDKKTGSINMGQNLHVAILPTGNSFEDAYEISEEAAKKLATDRLYSFDQDTKNGVTINRNKYISAYPSKFTKEQIETLEDSGIVKVGTVLHRGDPIVLSLGPKILTSADKTLGKLSKALRDSYTDRSQTWEHDYEGVVVDSVVTPKGVKVNVQAKPPVRVGDKLCYDPETEVLTSAGWKPISDVTLNDNVATLNPETLHFEYLRPAAVRAYEHRGKMYRLESQQVDVLVTPNHNMFVQPRNKTGFGFYRAESIFGKRVSYKKDGLWVGEDPEVFTLPVMLVGHRWGTVLKPEIHLRMETFLMLLGMFLSEGSCVEHKASATYGIDISQVKPDFVEEARAAFAAAGIDVTYTDRHFRIHGAQYLAYFRQFGHAPDKFIPDFVFGLSSRLQRILLKWLMWGDGHSKAGRYICYTTTSRRLADDVQRLCLHCGYAANVKYGRCKAGSSGGWCVDHEVTRRHDIHDVRIITDKLTPTVNHGHVRGQKAQTEEYVDYDGMVYCCTMPKWHAIYVRRNGKPYWCGNSPAFGLKGVVGKIVPQDQMPRNAVTNQPYDILMNTMGFLSRVAPGQLMEISLGKVAKQTGKQIRIPQLPPPEGWYNWTQKQLKDAGVSETSDVFDPVSGKTMKGIGDGYMYTMAFHHLAEKKASAVGNDAAFTQDEQPAKGGFSGGKKMSTMDLWGLLAHNAPDVIKDSQLIRGTKNDQYWRALQLGLPTPEPEEPFIYKKFLNTLRAGGVNVTEKGSITSIMPQTDKDVEQLSQGRVITSSDMVDSDFEPVKGGLFDLGKTGGMSGNQWSMIQLPEPVPNPIMEEPVRRLLGLTVDKMENILAGRDKLNGKTGGTALKEALSSIDVDKQINESRRNISTLRGQKRDDAVKIYRYLTAMKKQGLKPSDWMISKVPVLPPTFRPVSKMGDVALVSDMNELYKDIIENSKNFEDLRKEVDDSALADERLNIYNSVKAAYGLGESISPENAAKGIKGAIKQVIGSRPKHGLFQSKVLSKAVDGVSRGVISPDMNLDMDQCGIPETMAWPMYKPYVMRELIRNGYPSVQAVKMIADRTDTARSVLRKVMSQRPVILDRAPTWHKFNIMAFKPFLTEGDTIRVSPLIVSGFNADFDGDQMNAHVPSSDKAVQQALNKMLPSKNLTSLTDLSSPRHTPSKEQIFGLYALTKGMDSTKQVKVFNSVSEAKQAYARGEIGPNDPIEIK